MSRLNFGFTLNFSTQSDRVYIYDFSVLESGDGFACSGRWRCDLLRFSITAMVTLSIMLFLLLIVDPPEVTLRHLSPPPT